MGRYGVTLDEMKESTRAFFKNQRDLLNNRRNHERISNIQQHEKMVEHQSQPPSSLYRKREKEFDTGLFLILTTITGAFMYLFSESFRAFTYELVRKGLGQLEMVNTETALVVGLVVIVCAIALASKRK